MDESLNGWLVDMANVRRRLPRFAPSYDGLGLNQSESVDDDLSFDRLNGVDHDGH